jgi:hypothetical protein
MTAKRTRPETVSIIRPPRVFRREHRRESDRTFYIDEAKPRELQVRDEIERHGEGSREGQHVDPTARFGCGHAETGKQ